MPRDRNCEYDNLSEELRDELEREDYELEQDRRISNEEWEEEKERREEEEILEEQRQNNRDLGLDDD